MHEYEFNKAKNSVHEILGRLEAFPQLLDIEINKADIEQVIAKLYTSWK